MRYKHCIRNRVAGIRQGVWQVHALMMFLMRLEVLKEQMRTAEIDEFHERSKVYKRV